jgi:predicted ATPase
MLVDDAQWADLISLRWLAYMAARLEGVPLALVVAVRLGEEVVGQDVLDELAAGPGVQVLRPEQLSGGGVAVLVERRLGRPPDHSFTDACQLATGGNPFLLGELLDELGEARSSRSPPTRLSLRR